MVQAGDEGLCTANSPIAVGMSLQAYTCAGLVLTGDLGRTGAPQMSQSAYNRSG